MPFLGIVLVIIVSIVLAGIASLLLLLVTHVIVPKGATGRISAFIISGLFPFAVLAYIVVAFIAYVAVSESVGRPVDFGDAWTLSLGRGYLMRMIDTPEVAYLTVNGTEVINGVTAIEQVGTVVVGEKRGKSPNRNYFLLDMLTTRLDTFNDEPALRKAAVKHDIRKFTLQATDDFYYQHRFGSFERWSVIFIWLLPLLGLCGHIAFMLALRRRARQAAQ